MRESGRDRVGFPLVGETGRNGMEFDVTTWRAAGASALVYAMAVGLPLLLVQQTGRGFGLWPATAVGITCLMLFPRRQRVAVMAALVCTNALITAGFAGQSLGTTAMLVLAHVIGELGSVVLFERRVRDTLDPERPEHLAWFAVTAGGMALPLAAFIGSLAYDTAARAGFAREVLSWWLPEATITLLLVPACLYVRRRRLGLVVSTGATALECALLLSSLSAAVLLLAFVPWSWFTPPLSVAAAPLLLWATARCSVGFVATAVLLSAVANVTLTTMDIGTFARLPVSLDLRLMWAEVDALVEGFSYLALASAFAARRRVDSDRETAITALERSTGRLSAFFASTQAALAVADTEGRLLAITPAAQRLGARLLGAVKEGHRAFGFRGNQSDTPDRADAVADARYEVLREGWARAVQREVSTRTIILDNGHTGAATWTPLSDPEGNVLGAALAISDLTALEAEAVEVERARRLEMIGRLAGGIAHDFNNLLTVMLGNVEAVASSLPPDDTRQQELSLMTDAAQRAAGLTRQMLTFAKRDIISPAPITLETHLHGLLGVLRRTVGEDITLALAVEPAEVAVLMDPVQLDQVVMNLVVNAREAMPTGGLIDLRVTLEQIAEPDARRSRIAEGPYAVLTVRDEGSGMPPDVMDHIFEPFFTGRADGTGTGLGLATVDSIVRQAGGGLTVSSEVGVGSVFRVMLPLAAEVPPTSVPTPLAVQAGTEVGADTPAAAAAAAAAGRTVLVCEDDDAIRRFVTRVLTKDGFEVQSVGDATAAMALLRTTAFWAVVTDVVLSHGSGIDVAECARAVQPDIRVLFMTGYADQSLMARGLQLESRRLLLKPFDSNDLREAMRALADTGAP